MIDLFLCYGWLQVDGIDLHLDLKVRSIARRKDKEKKSLQSPREYKTLPSVALTQKLTHPHGPAVTCSSRCLRLLGEFGRRVMQASYAP